jgi:hypothetical protein
MGGLKLVGELGLDGSGFAAGLKKAEGLAASAGHEIRDALVGMIGIGTISLAISKTVQSVKELANASERLGVGTKNLQLLRKAANDAGVEFEKLERTFERIDVARFKALTPGSEGQGARRAFQQMGITPEMLRSMTASQLFMGPMAQMARSRSPAEINGLSAELGLKGFAQTIPVLKTNFVELEDRMKRFGSLIDAETIVRLKHLGDQFKIIGDFIVAYLGKSIVKATEGLMDGISRFLGWLDNRARPETPGEEPGQKRNWAGGLWGLSGRVGSGIMGGVTGVLGLWNEMIGNRERAEDRLIQSMGWFQSAGLPEGWVGEAADEMVRKMNKGAPGFKSTFDDARAQWEKQMKALAAMLENPEPPEGSFPGGAQKPSVKALEIPSDSLTRVGNFLGGSQNAIMRLAEQRTQYLRQIAQNTAHYAMRGGPTSSRLGMAAGMMTDPYAVFVPTH